MNRVFWISLVASLAAITAYIGIAGNETREYGESLLFAFMVSSLVFAILGFCGLMLGAIMAGCTGDEFLIGPFRLIEWFFIIIAAGLTWAFYGDAFATLLFGWFFTHPIFCFKIAMERSDSEGLRPDQ